MSTRHSCAFALLATLAITPVTLAEPPRPLGDSTIVAPVPFPGYPEGIAVHANRIYVSGPAAFGVPGNAQPSKIFAFNLKTGALEQTIAIQGQMGPLKAASCLTVADNGMIYVVEEEQGILKINPKTGQQTTYAGPFYPVYASPFNTTGAPYLLNDLAFDKNGYLYVTDSFQATIWRVPPGGGAPQVWFQSPVVDGVFGPNGARVDPTTNMLYFTVTLDGTGSGYVYRLPLKNNPVAADLQVVHHYAPTPFGPQAPDGIAFGKSGQLYVALAGSSQISVLNPNGTEAARYSGPARNPAGGPVLPWANPANIAFNHQTDSLLVTNHASLTGLPDPSPLFAVFDVYVNDKAAKTFTPNH